MLSRTSAYGATIVTTIQVAYQEAVYITVNLSAQLPYQSQVKHQILLRM